MKFYVLLAICLVLLSTMIIAPIYALKIKRVITLPVGWSEPSVSTYGSPGSYDCPGMAYELCHGNGLDQSFIYLEGLDIKTNIFRTDKAELNDHKVNILAEYLNRFYLELIVLLLIISSVLFVVIIKQKTYKQINNS